LKIELTLFVRDLELSNIVNTRLYSVTEH